MKTRVLNLLATFFVTAAAMASAAVVYQTMPRQTGLPNEVDSTTLGSGAWCDSCQAGLCGGNSATCHKHKGQVPCVCHRGK